MGKKLILSINAGSSSIKFDLFESTENPRRTAAAVIDKIGQPKPTLNTTTTPSQSVVAPNHETAAKSLFDWVRQQLGGDELVAVGHRIVHGGPKFYRPTVLTDEVVDELAQLTNFDPQHLPTEIKLVKAARESFPEAKHLACFDTTFHHDLPLEAQLLPIPRHFAAKGLRRYGFHGLSYAFLMTELAQIDKEAARGRVILAHLGSGASLTAVENGRSIDTTMGLTPASGVPMSTRSGDIDPGLELFLAKSESMNAEGFNDMVNFKSGLLGISETTADMEELLQHEGNDQRAADAVMMFCYQVKKSIGALAAALGGLDTLVFTGGMGEQAPEIRARVCDGLEFLGIEIDRARNDQQAAVISTASSRVTVRVIHTDEATTIARDVVPVLHGGD